MLTQARRDCEMAMRKNLEKANAPTVKFSAQKMHAEKAKVYEARIQDIDAVLERLKMRVPDVGLSDPKKMVPTTWMNEDVKKRRHEF